MIDDVRVVCDNMIYSDIVVAQRELSHHQRSHLGRSKNDTSWKRSHLGPSN